MPICSTVLCSKMDFKAIPKHMRTADLRKSHTRLHDFSHAALLMFNMCIFQVAFVKCSHNVVSGGSGFPRLPEPCHMWPSNWGQLWGPVLQLPAWENAAFLSWDYTDCATRPIRSGKCIVGYKTGTLWTGEYFVHGRKVRSGEHFVLY